MLPDDASSSRSVRMDLLDLDWFFIILTLMLAFDTKGTPGLELPSLPFTGYEPKASDARRFDTWFVLHKQVIRRDDVIVRPHL